MCLLHTKSIANLWVIQGNPELGLVQARWSFVNRDENLLTRLQNINLCFHFEVEQQVNGVFLNFFGFNGTAGVWRIQALEESGGWLERTTVEDMDIAVRAHLNGWKFIFLNDVKVHLHNHSISHRNQCHVLMSMWKLIFLGTIIVQVLCEVPESYEAYRKQQHRWHSGPMHLFRLCFPDIITAKVCNPDSSKLELVPIKVPFLGVWINIFLLMKICYSDCRSPHGRKQI